MFIEMTKLAKTKKKPTLRKVLPAPAAAHLIIYLLFQVLTFIFIFSLMKYDKKYSD